MSEKLSIKLEKARLCLLSYTSEEAFDDIQISAHCVWGQVVARALKERWLPGWIKKRFPVRYKKYDAYMIFPDLIKKYKPEDSELYLHYDGPDSILSGEKDKKED